MRLPYKEEIGSSNLSCGTMIYEYKGYKAELTTEITWMSCFGPDGCVVELKSDVIHCKSPDIEMDGSHHLVGEIYKKYFEFNVNKLPL
jgi:hypothetical protein